MGLMSRPRFSLPWMDPSQDSRWCPKSFLAATDSSLQVIEDHGVNGELRAALPGKNGCAIVGEVILG